MRLHADVHLVRWGKRTGRVLIPADPLTATVVHSPVPLGWSGCLVGSRADLLRLGAWIRLAAVSPHSLLFVPCRANPDPLGGWGDPPRTVDLVVVRSDAGLRPSAWKATRRQLRTASPATLHAPEARAEKPYRDWEWPEHRLIRTTEHAATLILSAPASTLLELGDTVTEAGNLVSGARDIHRHGQAYLAGLTGRLQGGLFFDIVGNDPLFHKRRRRTLVRRPKRRYRSPLRPGSASCTGGAI